MNVKLITVGKTSASYLKEGELEYQNRLKHYMKFERIDLADLKFSHKSHPFYTGKQKIIDTGGRVQRFEERFGKKK
jgi:ribosomal protein L31